MSVRQKAAQAWSEEQERRDAESRERKVRQVREEAEKDAAALESIAGSSLFHWFGHDWVVEHRNSSGYVILRTVDDDQEAPVWFAVRSTERGGWEVHVLDPHRVTDPRHRMAGATLVQSAAEVGQVLEQLARHRPLPADAPQKPPRPPAGESGVSKSPDGRR